MVKKGALLILFVAIITNAYSQASPGGVSGNLRWWLKANAGVYTDNGTTLAADGQLAAQWSDQSTAANPARQATDANKPVYRTGIINGNPVLRFTQNQFIDGVAPPGIAGNQSMQIFLVFKQTAYTAGGTTDGNGTFIIDRPTVTNNLSSFKIVNTDKYFYQKRNDGGGGLTGPVSVSSAPVGPFSVVSYYRDFNVDYGIFINGKLNVTSGGDSEVITVPNFRIGRHATTANGGLYGDFAEMIVYGSKPSAAERARITSYLAIKYGITLDQSPATNYVRSDGTVIYPATTTHDLYDNNIAGIGRDDLSGLNQTSSRSQNSQGIVQISNPSQMGDQEFLVWGNDAPTIWNSADVPAGYVNRISRIWRVSETGGDGDVGTFDISFDLTGLGLDLSDPTKFALLTDGDGAFDNATAHTTGRSIVGDVVSFTTANISNNQYFSLASSLIPGPGGVAATTVWLRADENVYVDGGTTLATNGQAVQTWQTRGGITAASASQGTAGFRPTLVTDAANGNPVVRFSGLRFLDFGTLGLSTTADLSFTTAFKPNTISGGTLTNASGTYIIDRNTNTNPVVGLKFLSTGKIGFQERLDVGGASDGVATVSNATTNMQIIDYYRDYAVRFGIFYNGALEATLDELGGPLTFPIQRIGARQDGGGAFDGDFAEYILFNRDITAGERNRIDSYLAIKYGVTLDQVTLTNYTASDGVVIYPAASTHSGYVSDITAIGRDNVSRLTQSNSKSVNTNSVLRISSPSSLDDLDFLICGDNAGSMTVPTFTGVDGTTIKRRLSREWYVAERNDVGTTTLAFDLTNVPDPKVEADLRLMIDASGSSSGYADDVGLLRTGTLAGQIFTVTNVNLANNDHFTIGSTNLASTPLPIQLTDFQVSAGERGVDIDWTTVNEINNDYFTIQRSLDGEKFNDVLRVAGAGTHNGTINYQAIDTPTTLGDIYYRLKQTDFDGKTSFSAIRKVTLTTSPFIVRMYPNPVDNGEFTVELPNENYAAAVEMLNVSGQIVYSGTTTSNSNKFNVSELPKGIYFVRVISNTGATTSKLVIR